MAGRPTDLTPALQKAICKDVANGNFPSAAAKANGVAGRTFFKWMKRGLEEPEGIYGQFRLAVKKAERESEVALIAEWRRHTEKNWLACAALLERRFPKRWSRPQQLQVQGTLRVTDVRDEILAKLARLAGDAAPELVATPVLALPAATVPTSDDGDEG